MKVVNEIPKNSILIDVRSPAEYQTEHITGSINIPVEDIQLAAKEIEKSKKEIVFVCKSGMRSEMACKKLPELKASVLKGGVHNYKTIKGTVKWDIERQIRLIVGVSTLIGTILAITISLWFLAIPLFFGAGLTFASLTNSCAMGMMLAKLPYNKSDYKIEEEIKKIK